MTIRPERSEKTASYSTDEAAVRDLFRRLLDAWGRGDGYAYGALFTEDADYIAFDGSHTRGREQIAFFHQQLFDSFLKGTRLTGRIESLKFLSPEVALVHTVGSTVMRGKSKPSPERDSIQTLVATKSEGEWLFAAFHNNRVRPISGRNPAAFLIWALTDLLWRIFSVGKRTALR